MKLEDAFSPGVYPILYAIKMFAEGYELEEDSTLLTARLKKITDLIHLLERDFEKLGQKK